MPMRVVVFLSLICCVPLGAQSWESLAGLKPGDRIRVVDTAGNERMGAFVAVSADSIALRTGKGEEAVSQARVRLVQIRTGLRRVRNVAIGAAIGLGIAIAVDCTYGQYMRNEGGDGRRGVTYPIPIALFGGIGAATPGYRTLYRAK